jgi:hypothetical protein
MLTILLALAASAPGVAGQSILSGTGLGTPLDALDARATALGGIGLGLTGGGLSPADPAAAADLTIPALLFTFHTSWVDATAAGGVDEFSGTRFPHIAASYPVNGVGTVSLGFGGVLDQRWRLEREQPFPGGGATARVTDTFTSDGGVSAVRVGVARRVGPALALGVQVGRHVGEVTRIFTRRFDSLEAGVSVPSYQLGGAWSYGGLTATVGAAVDLGSAARVSGSYTVSGDLDAEASEDTAGEGSTFDMPAELRVGASARLAPELSVVAGVHRVDWSSIGPGLEPGVSGRTVLSLGGGLEWTGSNVLGKPGALRLGYRRRDLPFATAAMPEPTESAFTFGVGMDLLRSENVTLARLDLALDRGSRDAGALEESFWRLSTSFRVSGF